MKRTAFFLYGVVCYTATVATLVYAAGFIANIGVPRSIDTAPNANFLQAVLIDLGLLGFFALQHSIMARRGFKAWWTRVVPQAIERSTYCLAASVAMGLMMWFWQPMGGTIWDFSSPALRYALSGISLIGWGLVYYSSFLINHFDLFGMRQVWLNLIGKPYTPMTFVQPTLYRYVRHPLYLGLLIAAWFTPTMTVAHLFFATGVLGYILVGIQFEERDMIAELGSLYASYRRRVPMLIPFLKSKPEMPEIGRTSKQGLA